MIINNSQNINHFIPLQQQDNHLDAQSQYLWRRISVPSDRTIQTYIPHIVSWFAKHKEGKPTTDITLNCKLNRFG